MQAPPLIALEIVLGFVAPIGWAIWELVSLRRERERDRAKAEAAAATQAARGGDFSETKPGGQA